MSSINKIYSVLFVAILMVSCGQSEREKQVAESEKSSAEYVEKASFTDFEGQTVDISEFKGKVILIDFWETWCRPCLDSFPTMQSLMNDYPDDFVVLAVTPGFTDTKEDAQEFISNHEYDFVYLLDSNNLHQKLQVQSIPFKVFLDARGNFIESSIGSYGPDADYKKAVDLIEKHKASVLSGN